MYKLYEDADKSEKVASPKGQATISIKDNDTPKAAAPVAKSGVNANVSYGGMATFKPSQAYLSAMQQTQALLDSLRSGKTSVSDQLSNVMNQITNREKFSYDADNDVMFQNNLLNSIEAGKMAMQDTMGQAAALTGGYGSSYATSAAGQAYNAYIQDAYNALPDYYNMAMQAYQLESDRLNNQYDMLQTADNIEYSRGEAAYQRELAKANQMYDQEYNNFWQTQQFNESVRQNNNALAQAVANRAYQRERDAVSDARWEKEYQLSLAAQNQKATDSAKKALEAEDLKEPSETQMSKAIKAYNEGGEKAYFDYIDSLPTTVDVTRIDDYVREHGNMKYSVRDYTAQTANPGWYIGKVADKSVVNDQFGTSYTLKELVNKLVAEGMSLEEAREFAARYNRA